MRGKKWISMLLAAAIGLGSMSASVIPTVAAEENISVNGAENDSLVQASKSVSMYRLYNPNSGEHFYTANAGERDSLTRIGWSYEGIGWTAPTSGNPVYRLYNPNSGDHHYTTSAGERDSLKKTGWRYEGIGWMSGGSVPIYRQYNPHAKAGSHNYTTSAGERDQLIRAGWRNEGVGWYGTAKGKSVTPSNKINYESIYRSYLQNAVRQELTKRGLSESESVYYGGAYALLDVNRDGILDLIASAYTGKHFQVLHIYSYNNGSVHDLGVIEDVERSGFDIAAYQDGFFYVDSYKGPYEVVLYRCTSNSMSLARKWEGTGERDSHFTIESAGVKITARPTEWCNYKDMSILRAKSR